MANKKTAKKELPIPETIKPIVETDIELNKEKKYWIKAGIAVSHIDRPGIKMRVQSIKKVSKQVHDGKGGMVPRTFIVGVFVAWIDKEDKYQKGMFSTRELIPYKEEEKK